MLMMELLRALTVPVEMEILGTMIEIVRFNGPERQTIMRIHMDTERVEFYAHNFTWRVVDK